MGYETGGLHGGAQEVSPGPSRPGKYYRTEFISGYPIPGIIWGYYYYPLLLLLFYYKLLLFIIIN